MLLLLLSVVVVVECCCCCCCMSDVMLCTLYQKEMDMKLMRRHIGEHILSEGFKDVWILLGCSILLGCGLQH